MTIFRCDTMATNSSRMAGVGGKTVTLNRLIQCAFMLVFILSQPVNAQDIGDQWERGDDPITFTSGLHHLASDAYITCSPHGGFVRVSVPEKGNHGVTLVSGETAIEVFQRAFVGGRIFGFTNAADPFYDAVLTNRSLTIDGKPLSFSYKDHRYFSLLMKICKENP